MIGLVLRRLALAIPVLLGLLVLMFILTRIVPADPAAVLAGETATARDIAALRTRLGLDQPLHIQFMVYLRQLATGDLGTSLYTHRTVLLDLASRLPATVELAFTTMLISITLGIPLGMAAALNRNGYIDQAIRVLTIGGLAVASFWLAIVLQLVLSVWLDLFPLRGRIDGSVTMPPPITGLFTVDLLFRGEFRLLVDALWHLVLPSVTLALPAIATIARFTRSSVIESMQREFVSWSRAAGYPRRILVWKYVLRSSLSATVSQIGLLFGVFLSGSIVVEALFSWPGLGDYLYVSVTTADYQPILGTTLAIGALYTLVNVAVDITQTLIDPRVAEQG